MSVKNITIKIEGDIEGYVPFECPYCNLEFKLNASEFQNEEYPLIELFCPYCGLVDEPNSFYTKDIIEHMHALAQNYMHEELNKILGKFAKSTSKNKFVKVKFKPLKPVYIKELRAYESNEDCFECKMCKNHVKVIYCAGSSKIYCPFCGVDI